jgi:uncharacterized protein (DUF1697 family)
MTRYVALLRGIGPTNPNMRNENLRRVCDGLGLENVQTVISTGNVVFDTDTSDVSGLEAMIEAAWPAQLGFTSTTILRSQGDLEDLEILSPFGELTHGAETYLLVTFSKGPLEIEAVFPHRPPGASYSMIGATDREVFTVADMTSDGSGVMRWLEGRCGREISSRTWLTVNRILKRMRVT